jgi:hypothetical protein
VGCKHNSREDFNSLAKEGSCIVVRTDAYAHPHHEKLAKHLYVFDIDVEAHQNGNGSIASTTAHGDRILGKIPEQNNLEN